MKRIDRIDGALAVALGFSLAWSAHACAEPAPAPPAPVDASPPDASASPEDAAPDATPVFGAHLGRYSTLYAYQGPHAPRAHNIERIARLFDFAAASFIGPGDLWSFNVVVGPRTEDNGFVFAPTIFLGEVMDDVGGGTCQVSSTIFAAALRAGLDVIERTPHSRPSKYIDKGLDATVSYPAGDAGPAGKLDLVLRNPYPFEVEMKVEIGDSGDPMRSLNVAFFGKEPGPVVDLRWKTASHEPPGAPRFHKTGKIRTATYKRRVQESAPGILGTLLVSRTYADGHSDERRFQSHYRPTAEVWEVGLDWDMSRNPWDPPAQP